MSTQWTQHTREYIFRQVKLGEHFQQARRVLQEDADGIVFWRHGEASMEHLKLGERHGEQAGRTNATCMV